MRIARFEHGGTVHTGIAADASATEFADLGGTDPIELLGRDLGALRAAHDGATARVPIAEVRLLAPIPRPPKFLAIGLNYTDHCAETGMPEPTFPVFFNKQTTCVVGPGDGIHVPRVSAMVDYECELGIVINRSCRHVPADRAHEVIGGYTVINDVTVRDWQLMAPTMTIGKSFDTHGPIGPWIVTPDEITDPQALRLTTRVNDEVLQDGTTADMIFTCAQQIETLSTSFTLEAGDVIATGTPAGVGLMRQPPRWLVPGDTVTVEVAGVGALTNRVVAEPADTARI